MAGINGTNLNGVALPGQGSGKNLLVEVIVGTNGTGLNGSKLNSLTVIGANSLRLRRAIIRH